MSLPLSLPPLLSPPTLSPPPPPSPLPLPFPWWRDSMRCLSHHEPTWEGVRLGLDRTEPGAADCRPLPGFGSAKSALSSFWALEPEVQPPSAPFQELGCHAGCRGDSRAGQLPGRSILEGAPWLEKVREEGRREQLWLGSGQSRGPRLGLSRTQAAETVGSEGGEHCGAG